MGPRPDLLLAKKVRLAVSALRCTRALGSEVGDWQ